MAACRHSFLLVAIFLALISCTLALPTPIPQPPLTLQLSHRRKFLRPQRKFCISWLHGVAQPQSTQTISSTTWVTQPATLTTQEITQTANPKPRIHTASSASSSSSSSLPSFKPPRIGEGDFASALPSHTIPRIGKAKTATATATHRKLHRSKKIPHFTDDEITEACLMLIYGANHLGPVIEIIWTTSTVSPLSQAITTQNEPLTLTLTETATQMTTITSTRYSTQTQIADEMTTQTSTRITPTTLVKIQLASDVTTQTIRVASIQTVPSMVIEMKPTILTETMPTTVVETAFSTETATQTSTQVLQVTATATIQSTLSETSTEILTQHVQVTATTQDTVSQTATETLTQFVKVKATAQSTISEVATETVTEIAKTTATAQSTLVETKVDILTSLARETLTEYTTTTSTVTSTVFAVITDIITLSSSATSATIIPTPVPTNNVIAVVDAKGQDCVLIDKTYTCTYTASDQHNGLVSSFTSPCSGSMSVQLDGGHGGNNYNNGGFAPGLSVSSRIRYGADQSTVIPANMIYDIFVGGNGNSGYYQGSSEGGFNGGGNGDVESDASGGGGATDIRYQGERLAVAAGGGGNGYSEGSDGYGNAQMPSLYVDDDALGKPIGKGQDTKYWGAGAGGGGYRGGQQGIFEGEGGYTGSNLGDVDLGAALGMPQAIVTFTCTI